MTFSKSSTSSAAEANSEENYEHVDYDNGYPYSAEYDGSVPPNMDGDDMYYQDPMPTEDIDYDDEVAGVYNADMENNIAGEITTNENQIFSQPLQVQSTTAAAKKNFFGSKAPPVKAKSNTSAFFNQSQNVSRAPSPPLSYISSDSSCGSNDSLVLSGESAEEPLSSVTSGIALATQTATEGFHDDIPMRASSPLTASTTEPAQAPRLDKVAKQLFFSPTATSAGGTVTKKPKLTTSSAAPAKPLASSSAPAARPFTAPSSFFSGTAPKFVTSQASSVPSFTTFRSASFTPTLGSGLASKKTTATANAATGSSKPPLPNSSVPSQQQHQQSAVASKPKPKPKSKSVTFQVGTTTVTPTAGAEATSISQRGDSIEEMTASVPSSVEGHSSPSETGSTRANFAPVTPTPHNNRSNSNSMMTTSVSDRATLHQVTPDTTNQYRHHTQDQQQQQQQQHIDGHTSRFDVGSDAVMVSPAVGTSRTVSADDGDDSHDTYGSTGVDSGSSSSLTLNATTHTVSASTLSLDSAARALSLCAQMDQQAEELQDRLRRARDMVRESRTAIVQQMHSAARIHSQYLVEDSVASTAPKLLELQRKMEQLRVRYKAIKTARDQQQRVPMPMPMEVA